MNSKKESILKQIESLEKKLSNPKELINYSLKLASNLSPIWESGDFYQNHILQNTLFPNGLVYDAKKDNYRTPVVNSMILCIADLATDLEKNKSRTSQNFFEKSGSVPGIGLEPIHSQ